MLKKLKDNYKNFDAITSKILKNGLKFCLGICAIAMLILLTYIMFFPSPEIYYIGLALLKLGLIFGIEFVICSFVVDGIKKQQIWLKICH